MQSTSRPEAFSLASVASQGGRWGEPLGHWLDGLRSSHAFLPALKRASWIMATVSDDALRNTSEAVPPAEEAARLSESRDAEALDALAAAYAEAGRFEDAVSTARKALALAGEAQSAPIRLRLLRYESSEPWREPQIRR